MDKFMSVSLRVRIFFFMICANAANQDQRPKIVFRCGLDIVRLPFSGQK